MKLTEKDLARTWPGCLPACPTEREREIQSDPIRSVDDDDDGRQSPKFHVEVRVKVEVAGRVIARARADPKKAATTTTTIRQTKKKQLENQK